MADVPSAGAAKASGPTQHTDARAIPEGFHALIYLHQPIEQPSRALDRPGQSVPAEFSVPRPLLSCLRFNLVRIGGTADPALEAKSAGGAVQALACQVRAAANSGGVGRTAGRRPELQCAGGPRGCGYYQIERTALQAAAAVDRSRPAARPTPTFCSLIQINQLRCCRHSL